MKKAVHTFVLVLTFLTATITGLCAQSLTIAAASDLKFAMDEILEHYQGFYPGDPIDIIYGSSGRFAQQIENGAPFDVFFSASLDYPADLYKKGFAATEPAVYALGRLVIWSRRHDASEVQITDLVNNNYRRIAIASPNHAPYGMRAQEALQSQGVWPLVQPKLVIGENIAHTAQLIESGAANIGIIALALALNPQLAQHGGYSLIPEHFHAPLEQAFIITRRAEHNNLAFRFVDFMATPIAHEVMTRYGFMVTEAH